MMNPEIKQRWVKALRSGKYTQGRTVMVDSIRGKDKFCCLGVLCDIQEPNRVMWGPNTDNGNAVPPSSLKAGLSTDDTHLMMEANDTHKWTFEDIATYIEVML